MQKQRDQSIKRIGLFVVKLLFFWHLNRGSCLCFRGDHRILRRIVLAFLLFSLLLILLALLFQFLLAFLVLIVYFSQCGILSFCC
jgi:hypothetical protein